jgi:hypothetical protein
MTSVCSRPGGRIITDIRVSGQTAGAAEPDIAAAAQAERAATREQLTKFWTAAADGLLPSGADLDWIIDTAVMTCSADSYLHAHRTLGWSADTYAHWLEATWRRIAGTTSTESSRASGKSRRR